MQVQRQTARVDQLKRQAAMNAAHEAEQLEKAREAEGRNPAQQALKVSYDYVEGTVRVASFSIACPACPRSAKPLTTHLHTRRSGHGVGHGQTHRRSQKVRQGPRQRTHVVRALRPQLHDVCRRLGEDLQPHLHAQGNGPLGHRLRPQKNPGNCVQAVFDGVFSARDDRTRAPASDADRQATGNRAGDPGGTGEAQARAGHGGQGRAAGLDLHGGGPGQRAGQDGGVRDELRPQRPQRAQAHVVPGPHTHAASLQGGGAHHIQPHPQGACST